jgi:hypothetical protein
VQIKIEKIENCKKQIKFTTKAHKGKGRTLFVVYFSPPKISWVVSGITLVYIYFLFSI